MSNDRYSARYGTWAAARARMPMGQAMHVARVACASVEALGRRTTVRPGALSKLHSYSVALLPRVLRVRLIGVGGMTQHQQTVSTLPSHA